jgi:hypothetical protein
MGATLRPSKGWFCRAQVVADFASHFLIPKCILAFGGIVVPLSRACVTYA